MKILETLLLTKPFIDSVNKKIYQHASKAHKSVKQYLADEENIKHISLMVYDSLPLFIKFGLKHDKFYEKFKVVFVSIRNQLFHYEEENFVHLEKDSARSKEESAESLEDTNLSHKKRTNKRKSTINAKETSLRSRKPSKTQPGKKIVIKDGMKNNQEEK